MMKIVLFSIVFIFVSGCGTSGQKNKDNNNSETMIFHVEEVENIMKFEITLTNHSSDVVLLQFPSGQIFEIIVKDQANQEVYRYSQGRMFTMAITTKEIQPSEIVVWSAKWDMKVNGQIIQDGAYYVTAELQMISINGEQVDREQFTISKEIVVQ